ncbi:hypothetical protein [Streptomyces sp. YIM 98790]|uniref:hypothetical protein n=1 Tax=Streptomyces sp. YIM 98790 TaxID=2689077 RepID=UPI00140A830F|nr:hypothetical protein [Streptomyces sp. YIM 98790]
MERRGFGKGVLTALAAGVTLPALAGPRAQAVAADPVEAGCRRSLDEYTLPWAEQTHEIVQLADSPVLLISQMEPSALVKVALAEESGLPHTAHAFPLGAADARAHGLALSRAYPGKVWCTLEGAHRLLLVDPHPRQPDRPPTVLRTLDLPPAARGPHYVGEYGDDLWATCKASGTVLRISHRDPERHRVYRAEPDPIFIARHPVNGHFYVSQDRSSAILRIDPRSGDTRQFPVPAEAGSTPVGLIAGPEGVWVVLLGTQGEGTGTFGRIAADDTMHWHRLRSPGLTDASLLHLAFGTGGTSSTGGAGGADARRELWLLASSIINSHAIDMIIHVGFSDGWRQITTESAAALPTQLCKAHRLLVRPGAVHATELSTATLATLRPAPDCTFDHPVTEDRHSTPA